MKRTGTTLLAQLNALPPFQVRLLALNGSRPIATKELAAKAGLSCDTIKRLSRSETWVGYELKTIISFTSACGVDLLHQKYARLKLMRMIKSARGPAHLNSPQRRYWNSIFTGEKLWRKTS